jgi:hypothetical protein
MAHEILSVKLCQLEERLAGLHSRIRMSETADHSSLSREIGVLKSERSAANAAMRENLERSRSCVATILGRGYSQVEQVVLDSRRQLEELARSSPDEETAVEEKILLAEYALDFAYQAADEALLLSMTAIDACRLRQEEGRYS